VPFLARQTRFKRKTDWHAICGTKRVSPEQIELVQKTWRLVLPVGDTAAELFYGKLFSLDPSLQKLFSNDMRDQGRNLTAMISVAVHWLARPEKIVIAVQQLGRRHAAYGVQPRHYDLVAVALLWMLESCLGDAFTPEARSAWTAVYEMLAKTMQEAAYAGHV
jgi:hemoglobin-like flavoprotein